MRRQSFASPCALALAAAAALALLHAPSARAAFGGNLSTVVRAYDSLLDIPGIQRVRSWRSFDQYARLTWDDLGGRKAWTIDTSLRWRTDWNTGKGLDDNDFDVMIARATWRSKGGILGLQLGRIQSLTGFGWKAYDGVRLDFPRLAAFRAFCFAGAPVELAVNGAPDLGNFTWGAGATGILPEHGSIGVDYELRRFGSITTEETAGFDMDLRFKDTEIAANADYAMVLDTFGETMVAVRQAIARKHHAELRWDRVEPVFPADSIYAVFESNPYDEIRLSYEFQGDAHGLAVGGYVSHENYEDTALPGPQDIERASATVRWEDSHHGKHRSEAGWLDGWSGSRLALRHDSDWNVTRQLRIGFGGSMQDFENYARLTERDQIWAVRARVHHDHAGKWDLGLEVEQFFGRDRDTTRGTLVFGTRFGSARHERPWYGGHWNEAWKAPPVATSAATPTTTETPQ